MYILSIKIIQRDFGNKLLEIDNIPRDKNVWYSLSIHITVNNTL